MPRYSKKRSSLDYTSQYSIFYGLFLLPRYSVGQHVRGMAGGRVNGTVVSVRAKNGMNSGDEGGRTNYV